MQNQLIYGGGIGLDFVTYYDMVFRLEYGINKFKELGFLFILLHLFNSKIC